MVRNLTLILAVALMASMGCGEAPATEEQVEEIVVISPIADPGALTYYRDQTGDVLYIEVTGSEIGSV